LKIYDFHISNFLLVYTFRGRKEKIATKKAKKNKQENKIENMRGTRKDEETVKEGYKGKLI